MKGGEPGPTDGVAELLFSLANSDRLDLLTEISIHKQRMSSLSKAINASTPECSRHLARLTQARLVEKDSDGLYELTAVGGSILKLLQSVRVIQANKEYFLSHDLSGLPPGFLERIGDLGKGELVRHVGLVLMTIRMLVSMANDHVWLISDHLFPQWPGIADTFSKTIPVKLICEQTIDPKIVSDYRTNLPRSQIKALKEVKIAMAISEASAGVCFPNLDGEIDFNAGFAGTDPAFRSWCSDLFDYYWAKTAAQPQ